MHAPDAQVRTHGYVSGWCESTWHDRCQGSYAGTACNCPCHRQAGPEQPIISGSIRPVSRADGRN